MPRTRGLLWCGVVGPVAFVIVLLANDTIKPSYEPVRDFVSEAAIGEGGWVQIANFLIAGGLLTLSSPALSRVVSRWTGRLVRIVGVSLMGAGVFVSDPVPNDDASWHGIAHNLVSVAVFAALSLACFTAARWRPTAAWRTYCFVIGAALPVLFVVAGGASDTSGLWQRLTIVAGWTWLAALSVRAMRSLERTADGSGPHPSPSS